MDVRDFRAKLVAQQRAEEGGSDEMPGDSEGWIYETPLIEKGAVLLGGTRQKFGFALRQQYFHKCVLLLLEHDAQFTKGIILNRPTALKLEGWSVWFGGDVCEGGFFRGQSLRQQLGEEGGAMEAPMEVCCLHRLDSAAAMAVSQSVIKSISYTSFDSAKRLVAEGHATKNDFWLFIGYCGWAPNQLQGELERDSWYMAAADSTVLLNELLTQAADPLSLPRLSGEKLKEGGDGIATWNRLMLNIGRAAEVQGLDGEADAADATGPAETEAVEGQMTSGEQLEADDAASISSSWKTSQFDDNMLREWVRQKLTGLNPIDARSAAASDAEDEDASELDAIMASDAAEGAEASPADAAEVVRGTLLRSTLHPSFILDKQFMYKSLLVVVDANPKITLAVVLNRPTNRVVRLSGTDVEGGDEISRRISFGGDLQVAGRDVYMCLVRGGEASSSTGNFVPLGDSGIYRVGNDFTGELHGDGLLLVKGFVYWEKDQLQRELEEGKFTIMNEQDMPWEDLWALASPEGVEQNIGWTSSQLGTEVWREAGSKEVGEGAGVEEFVMSGLGLGLGDLALLEWAKVFAGGPIE